MLRYYGEVEWEFRPVISIRFGNQVNGNLMKTNVCSLSWVMMSGACRYDTVIGLLYLLGVYGMGLGGWRYLMNAGSTLSDTQLRYSMHIARSMMRLDSP